MSIIPRDFVSFQNIPDPLTISQSPDFWVFVHSVLNLFRTLPQWQNHWTNSKEKYLEWCKVWKVIQKTPKSHDQRSLPRYSRYESAIWAWLWCIKCRTGSAIHHLQFCRTANSENHLIAFSRLFKSEVNYIATDLEISAVIWSLELWQYIFTGGQYYGSIIWPSSFELAVENAPYKGKHVCWRMRLQYFDFNVHLRPGAEQYCYWRSIPRTHSTACSRIGAFVGLLGSIHLCVSNECYGDPCQAADSDTKMADLVQCDECSKWF